MTVAPEFEVFEVDAESGSLECEVLRFEVSLCRSRAAMTVTAEERAIPVFEERKVKRREEKKKGGETMRRDS